MSVETVVLRTRRGWFYRVPKSDLQDKTIAEEWINKIAEAAGVRVKILTQLPNEPEEASPEAESSPKTYIAEGFKKHPP